MDKEAATEATVFDFEDPNFMKVGSQSLTNEKVEWKVDATGTVEGDCDGDGKINAIDLVLLYKELAG